MRIATPIAAPMNSAPRKNGENSSITAMPIMVSQIAGRQSRQSPLIGHPLIAHPLWLLLPGPDAELGRQVLLDRRHGAEGIFQVGACQPAEPGRVDVVVGLETGA